MAALGAKYSMGEIRVNKPEAARRQIDLAIRLLFDNEDPIPIHTLAMAGFRILRDLAKDQPKSYMEQSLKKILIPGKEGEFWKAMHRPANFFKHAESDPDDILENVQEEINDATLFLSSMWYQDLGYKQTPEMAALMTWFHVLHPHLVLESALIKPMLGRNEFEGFRKESRIEQLQTGKWMIEMARKELHGT